MEDGIKKQGEKVRRPHVNNYEVKESRITKNLTGESETT